MMEAIPEYEKGGLKEKVSPLDSLVKKFERQGYTVEQAFYLFDDNGDGLLTSKEVRAGFRDQELDALDTEIDALIVAIDKDANGMVSLPEWVAVLSPKLEVEKDFRAIMSNVDIDDPIDLEEKTLDLRFRTKALD
jgi:Ca2+-binding EF-hand superfamily protein